MSPADARPAPALVGGQWPADFVVAASDSHDRVKANADLVCSGSGDVADIQDVMDEAYSKDWGGAVLLLPGTYDWDDELTVQGGCTLFGCGVSTNLEGNNGKLTMEAGSTVHSLQFRAWGTNDYAIDMLGDDGSVYDVRLYGYTSKGIGTAQNARIINSLLANFGVDGVELRHVDGLVAGCHFAESGVHTTGSRNMIASNSFEMFGEYVLLDGNDDEMTANKLAVGGSPDNTKDAVRVSGTQESFVDNRVCAISAAGSRCRYGVNILGTANGARVKYNDLRPQSGLSWGTAALVDFGTASLVGSND